MSPVIWTLRKKAVLTCRSLVQVAPLSVEKRQKELPPRTNRSRKRTSAKQGEAGLLSAQPDSRSSCAGVNAEMGPAIRVRGSGGLVPTQALTTAAGVEPDCEPGSGWAVIENNGVAERIREGALTVAVVRRVKVVPPSVETDAPEMLMGVA